MPDLLLTISLVAGLNSRNNFHFMHKTQSIVSILLEKQK